MRALRRIPVHMSYNVTALDREGARPRRTWRRTGRPTSLAWAVATNQQEQVEWTTHVAAIRSVERRKHLEDLRRGQQIQDVVAACLRPPLYATRFHEGFGTLYTAESRPAEGRALSLARTWPGNIPSTSSGRIASGSTWNHVSSIDRRRRGTADAQGRLKATLTQVPPGPDAMLIRSATCRTSHNPCPGALDIDLARVRPERVGCAVAAGRVPGGIFGSRRITIVNLTAQFPDQIPYAQPSRPRAMADGVGRQFVNGKNHIRGPVLR